MLGRLGANWCCLWQNFELILVSFCYIFGGWVGEGVKEEVTQLLFWYDVKWLRCKTCRIWELFELITGLEILNL